jgi:hypothetical protein
MLRCPLCGREGYARVDRAKICPACSGRGVLLEDEEIAKAICTPLEPLPITIPRGAYRDAPTTDYRTT